MLLSLCLILFSLESFSCIKFSYMLNKNVSDVSVVKLFIPTSESKNSQCKEHSRFYIEELLNYKLWATEMFDATAKFPSGILHGSTFAFGNFDQCLEINVPYRDNEFRGQYCMATFTIQNFSYTGDNHTINFEYDAYNKFYNISVLEKLMTFHGDDSKIKRQELHFAFCLPSSCTNEDLKDSLEELSRIYLNNFNIGIEVDKKVVKYLISIILIMEILRLFVSSSVFMVLIGSTYDLYSRTKAITKRPRIFHNILLCFSFQNNLKKLSSASKNEDGLDCLSGLKVISMFLIIFGHRCMFLFGAPMVNPPFLEKIYTRVEATVILNGTIVVDTFFLMSGFLATYLTMSALKNARTNFNLFLLYVHRLIRILPAYAVIIAFYCTVFVSMGSGPFWQQRIGLEKERCINSWWTNILYINNYIYADKMCIFQSWYLTCDMHYFLTVPVLVWLLKKKPTFGLTVIFGIIIASILTVLVTVYLNNEDAILLLYPRVLKDPVANKTFRNIYIPTHMRASPYYVGMLTGYFKYKLMNSEYKIPKYLTSLVWILTIPLSLCTIQIGYIFYLPEIGKNSIISAVYASIYHFTFSIGIGWLILAVSSGKGSWIKPILSCRPFIFLSRITYTAFLCHGAVQMYTAAVMRNPNYGNILTILKSTASDIVAAYTFGFLLSMYFEAPVIGIEKIVFGRKVNQNMTDNQKMPEETTDTISKIKTIQ